MAPSEIDLSRPVCDTGKPMIVQCACGKWEIQLLCVTGAWQWILHGPERFESKTLAAETLAERILQCCSPDQLQRIS